MANTKISNKRNQALAKISLYFYRSDPGNGEVIVLGTIKEGSVATCNCNPMYTQTNGSTKRMCEDRSWTLGMPAVCSLSG